MTTKTTLAQHVGARARTIRDTQGLTQRQIADKAGMVHQEVSRFESGTSNPRLDTLEQIADALDVSVEELVKDS